MRAVKARLGRPHCIEGIPSTLCGESGSEQAWKGEERSQTIFLARQGRMIGMCPLLEGK